MQGLIQIETTKFISVIFVIAVSTGLYLSMCLCFCWTDRHYLSEIHTSLFQVKCRPALYVMSGQLVCWSLYSMALIPAQAAFYKARLEYITIPDDTISV